MTRARLKQGLRAGRQVSPFLVLGDPTPELSLELAKAAVDAGANMLELGMPYGDPVADGPAIQAADVRALEGGTSTSEAIAILARIHEAHPETPKNLLVYGNLVHARGFDRFCGDVSQAGASSLLVPDIPLEESPPLKKACGRAHLGHVQLVGPLTNEDRLRRIDRLANAFLYLVAHQGVTGVGSRDFQNVCDLVTRTAALSRHPLCLGFGLSESEQIRMAFDAGATIAVVGSHLARVIGSMWEQRDDPQFESKLITAFGTAVRGLVAGRSEGK